MHETGCLGLVHWDDPEGWDGEGDRRGVQDGEHRDITLPTKVRLVKAIVFPGVITDVRVGLKES